MKQFENLGDVLDVMKERIIEHSIEIMVIKRTLVENGHVTDDELKANYDLINKEVREEMKDLIDQMDNIIKTLK